MHDDRPGDPAPTDALVVRGRDVAWMTVHSWMRDGQMQTAWPGQGRNVPPDATEIGVKLINFPVGAVREIILKTGARTHPHGSYEDVLFYQIDGRRVQMCEDESGTVNPGDVSFEPHGVEHSTYQLIEGRFVEFALPAPARIGGRGQWLRADQARVIDCAVWETGGATVCAEGAEAYWAPREALHHERRIFSFPGHELIETRLGAGTCTAPRVERHDTLFHIVAGRLSADLEGRTQAVEAGDSLRAPAGTPYAFSAEEDAVLIQAAARRI